MKRSEKKQKELHVEFFRQDGGLDGDPHDMGPTLKRKKIWGYCGEKEFGVPGGLKKLKFGVPGCGKKLKFGVLGGSKFYQCLPPCTFSNGIALTDYISHIK